MTADGLNEVLFNHYSLHASVIAMQEGGWSALAYRAETDKGIFFLKVYDKKRAFTAKAAARIDAYIPVLAALGQSVLKGRVPRPVQTKDGQNKCEDENAVYLLYDYINAKTVREEKLLPAGITALAGILSDLHNADVSSFNLPPLTEDFSVPFSDALEHFFGARFDTLPEDVKSISCPFDWENQRCCKTSVRISRNIDRACAGFCPVPHGRAHMEHDACAGIARAD